VEGSRRFHILRSWDQDGYRVAEVEWLQDIPLPEGSQQKREVKSSYVFMLFVYSDNNYV